MILHQRTPFVCKIAKGLGKTGVGITRDSLGLDTLHISLFYFWGHKNLYNFMALDAD